MKTRMNGAIVSFAAKLKGLRTGRASPTLLEPIKVNVHGASMSINQLGTVSAPEPKLLMIQVWDESQTSVIDKAIRNSGLGLNPSSDGKIIRVPIPAPTEERRRDLVKKASEYAEAAKIAIRNVRNDEINASKRHAKTEEISKDELRRETEKIKKIAEGYIKQVEQIAERKTAEIMEI